MATDMPLPLLLTLASASFSFLFKLALPQVLPDASLTEVFIVLTSVSLSLWAIWTVLIYPNFVSPIRHVPVPKGGRPLIRFAGVEFERPKGAVFLDFMNAAPHVGMFSLPGLFNAAQLFPTSPAALGEVLVHKSYHFQKPGPVRDFLRRILGNGLVIVEEDEHKFQRKHVAPAFSYRHIKDLYPFFWNKAVELTRCVTDEASENNGVVEVGHWGNKVTMDIIGVAGAGRNFNTLRTSNDEIVTLYEEITEPTREKAVFFVVNLLLPRWIVKHLPWELNRRLETTTGALRRMCNQMLLEKRELIKYQGDDHVDILSTLIKSGDFSNDMLIDQLLTFLAAGHETTSSAFTWATYLLARNPHIQTALRAEIRAAFPNGPTAIPSDTTVAEIIESQCPILHGTCNETLRLYPTVPSTIRIAVQDTTINNTPVKKGTKVFIIPWAINRSNQHWGPDAESFVPERWITETTGEDGKVERKGNNTGGVTSNYSMLTFLHGPRSCIGEKFAKAELKALVALWVGTFEFEQAVPGEIAVPAGVITVKPQNGMRLRIKRVPGWNEPQG